MAYKCDHLSYVSTTDPNFLNTLEKWLQVQPEILILIRYSAAAGSRDFEFFRSFSDLLARLHKLPHRACVTAFHQPQLPFRGLVDDEFISKCLNNIPDGAEYLVAETVQRTYGSQSWFHHSAGMSHGELREELKTSRGTRVAVGLYPDWLEDNENVISAVVPDEDGVARVGIY